MIEALDTRKLTASTVASSFENFTEEIDGSERFLNICSTNRDAEVELVSSSPSDVIGLALFVFCFLYVPLCLIHFELNKNKQPYSLHLRKRNTKLLYGICFASMGYAILSSLREFLGPQNFSCDLLVFLFFITGYLAILPTVVRFIIFYWRIQFHIGLINETFGSVIEDGSPLFQEETDLQLLKTGTPRLPKTRKLTRNLMPGKEGRLASARSRMQLNLSETASSLSFPGPLGQISSKILRKPSGSMVTSLPSSGLGLSSESKRKKKLCVFQDWALKKLVALFLCISPLVYCLSCWKTPEAMNKNLRIRYFLSSKHCAKLLLVLMFLLYGMLLFTFYGINFAVGRGCVGCSVGAFLPLLIGLLFVVLVFLSIGIMLTWKHPDTLGIKKELCITIVVFCLSGTFFALNDEQEESTFRLAHVSQLIHFALIGWALPYQVLKAKRMKAISEQDFGDDVPQDKPSLLIILDSPEGSKAFALHLASEIALENLYFYKATIFWVMNFERLNENELEERAKHIRKTYLCQASVLEVNIGGDVKEGIEKHFSEKSYTKNMFEDATSEVFSLMENDSFPRFIETNHYKAYTNKLKSYYEGLYI